MEPIKLDISLFKKDDSKLNVAICDAELLGRYMNRESRMSNLALMKLSSYHKKHGDNVTMILNYDELDNQNFDKIYLGKIFTGTKIPEKILERDDIIRGGTGFFFDKAPFLPDEIEHSKPDYRLYDEYIDQQLAKGVTKKKLTYFMDYNWGFLVRFCIRQCDFCVLRNYTKTEIWSPIKEFHDPSRKYIGMLDDNFLAYKGWKEILNELLNYGKPILFKQGLDLRLMTDEKAQMLAKFKFPSTVKFAYDNIADTNMIMKKIDLWKQYHKKPALFFLLCGFDRNDKWDQDFWIQDMKDLFTRVVNLMKKQQMPYCMRYEKAYDKTNVINGIMWSRLYSLMSAWLNQARFFITNSFREYLAMEPNRKKFLDLFEAAFPDIVEQYFDEKFLHYSPPKEAKIEPKVLSELDAYYDVGQ